VVEQTEQRILNFPGSCVAFTKIAPEWIVAKLIGETEEIKLLRNEISHLIHYPQESAELLCRHSGDPHVRYSPTAL
jgi:hypothetical protein